MRGTAALHMPGLSPHHPCSAPWQPNSSAFPAPSLLPWWAVAWLPLRTGTCGSPATPPGVVGMHRLNLSTQSASRSTCSPPMATQQLLIPHPSLLPLPSAASCEAAVGPGRGQHRAWFRVMGTWSWVTGTRGGNLDQQRSILEPASRADLQQTLQTVPLFTEPFSSKSEQHTLQRVLTLNSNCLQHVLTLGAGRSSSPHCKLRLLFKKCSELQQSPGPNRSSGARYRKRCFEMSSSTPSHNHFLSYLQPCTCIWSRQ